MRQRYFLCLAEYIKNNRALNFECKTGAIPAQYRLL